jgi:hypothetical protein
MEVVVSPTTTPCLRIVGACNFWGVTITFCLRKVFRIKIGTFQTFHSPTNYSHQLVKYNQLVLGQQLKTSFMRNKLIAYMVISVTLFFCLVFDVVKPCGRDSQDKRFAWVG